MDRVISPMKQKLGRWLLPMGHSEEMRLKYIYLQTVDDESGRVVREVIRKIGENSNDSLVCWVDDLERDRLERSR
jgi:hypothetical protein